MSALANLLDVRGVALGRYAPGAYYIDNVFAVIPAGFGQTQTAVYTVAAGYQGLVLNVSVSAFNNAGSAQEVTAGLVTRDNGASIWRTRSTFVVSNTDPVHNEYTGGLSVPPLTDIALRALTATGDNLTMVARLELCIIKVS